MNKYILIICLTIASAYASPNPDHINRDRLLFAIAQIESNHNHKSVGRAGEVGKYQMKESTWRDYSRQSPQVARTDKGQFESRRVATAHLNAIINWLKKHDLEMNVFNCALTWNAGFGTVSRNKVSSHNKKHAQKVLEVYNSLSDWK